MSYRTGIQFDNKTSLDIVSGKIVYHTEDIGSNDIAGFFSNPQTSIDSTYTTITGSMSLKPQQYRDHYVDIFTDRGYNPIAFQLTFSNGQTISFDSLAREVYAEIDTPQWMPVGHPGAVGAPPVAIGVSRWTRHDSGITEKYPYGLITFTIADATATKRWMSVTKKPETTPLNQFTIPGTHDTGTWTMGSVSQCQTMILRQQLDQGIRFIDLRLEPIVNGNTTSLKIYHGVEGSTLDFQTDIMPVCEAFLKENPSETIIMLINRNDNPFNNVSDARFIAFVNYIIVRNSVFLIGPAMPTLHNARTRIIVVTRHPGLKGMALYPGWPKDATGTLVSGNLTVEIQDIYKFGGVANLPGKIAKKWSFVEDYLGKASGHVVNPAQPTWYINFSSATGTPGYMNPLNMVEGFDGNRNGINNRLLAYLTQHPKGYYGTVVMDFPEYPDNCAIIQKLIESNN
jgi:1-phosphatidylinositol phosphodiesterase